MNSDNVAMQVFLSGWLLGTLHKEGREAMKITKMEPGELTPYGFEVTFASGLKIGVRTELLEAPGNADN